MDRKELWQELRPHVVRTGHYVYSSRRHGEDHTNFVSGHLSEQIRKMLLRECVTEFSTLSIGPMSDLVVVGTGCGYWYAAMLAEQLGVPSVYAERHRLGQFVLRRDQSAVVRAKNILLFDDVVSTGASAQQLCDMLMGNRANVVSALFLLNRGNPASTNWVFAHPYAIPVRALFSEYMETWPRAECPLCRSGVPFSTEYGKGEDEMFIHGQPQPKL